MNEMTLLVAFQLEPLGDGAGNEPLDVNAAVLLLHFTTNAMRMHISASAC